MCQAYPTLYYTVQVLVFPHLDHLQGASLLSLTLVTLNRAAMLFIPGQVSKVAKYSRISFIIIQQIFTNTKIILGHQVPVNSILLLSLCWVLPLLSLLPTILGVNGCFGSVSRMDICWSCIPSYQT